jgi:hypothetical protein
MAAGDYRTPFLWEVRSDGAADGYGQKPAAFTAAPGYLWGTATDRTAAAEEAAGNDLNRTRALVKLRNHPAVAPRDRLTDQVLGDVWTVAAVWKSGPNETVCEVYAPCRLP